MINIEKAYTSYAFFYFFPLILFGSYFLLNLTLAVIKYSFTYVMGEYWKKVDMEDDVDFIQTINIQDFLNGSMHETTLYNDSSMAASANKSVGTN